MHQGFFLSQFMEDDYNELLIFGEHASGSVTVEAQVPSTPFSKQQGFHLSHFLEDGHNQFPIFQEHASLDTTALAYRSREPSVAVPQPATYPSVQDWGKIKLVFTRLYRTEGRTLKDVRTILQRDYGFVATYMPSTTLPNLVTNILWQQ
jgi:Clr5 domain